MCEIVRTGYLEKIKSFLSAPMVTVITGMRRVGKSVLMRQLADELENQGQVLRIDKESLAFDHLQTATDLVDYVHNQMGKTGHRYILIDEVQQIHQWQRAAASLNSEDDTHLIISGSNASLLSGDLASLLAGRYISLNIYPFSLSEFAELHSCSQGQDRSEEELFRLYLRLGGLPGMLHTDLSEAVIRQMQADIIHTVAVRDIISRHHIRDIRLFESILQFAMDNIGNILSAKRIHDYLKKERKSLSVDSVLNYLRYMQEGFLLSEVPRFDLKGKKYLEIGSKYYPGDIGIRNGLISPGGRDINGVLETLVYLELCRRGYRVFIGTLPNREIDFVAERDQKRYYLQVAYLLESQETIDRETAALQDIQDAYPKYLLSMDQFQADDFEGIRHRSLLDFLRGKDLDT
jgi:hypothetical protein